MSRQPHHCEGVAHASQLEQLWRERNEYAALARAYREALANYRREHDRAAGGLCACHLCRLAGPLLEIE